MSTFKQFFGAIFGNWRTRGVGGNPASKGCINLNLKPVPGYVKHPGSAWIDEHWNELPKGNWVAADIEGLVAYDPDNQGLMTKLALEDVEPASVDIAFIPQNDGPTPKRQTQT